MTAPPPDLAVAVRLEPGEAIRWSGRPALRHFRSEAWAAFVFGLILLAASAGAWLISAAVAREALRNGKWGNLPALPIALAPAVGFGVFGLRAVATPWTFGRALRRTLYVVTDRRVVVIAGPGYERSGMLPSPERDRYEFAPDVIRARLMKKRNGNRVDLVLGTERQGRSEIDVGILGVDDWAAAERAMNDGFPS